MVCPYLTRPLQFVKEMSTEVTKYVALYLLFDTGTSDSDYRALYKLFSCLWILIGLASVALLLSNIQDLYKRTGPEAKAENQDNSEVTL